MVLCKVRFGLLARKIESAMNRFYTKQIKIYGLKNFYIWFFLNVPKKVFISQKINLGDSLIYGGGWRQRFPKSIIGQTGCEAETRTIDNNTFKFYLFMIISNAWTVQLRATNLR